MAAIYQWFTGGDVIVTTPLYPIHADEAVQVTLDIRDFELTKWESSYSQNNHVIVSPAYRQRLLVIPYEESYSQNSNVISTVEWVDRLLVADPEYSYTQNSNLLGPDPEYRDILITIYTPTEELETTIAVAPAEFEWTYVPPLP